MSPIERALRRVAFPALLAMSALALLAPAAGASPAEKAADAADWLKTELTEGDHFVTHYWNEAEEVKSFPDIGLTIDGNLAFLAANTVAGYTPQIEATAEWVEENAAGYYGGGTCDPESPSGEVYAAPLAKLAVFRLANEINATAAVEQLECLRQGTGEEAGRISDQSEFGDFSNTFGQALGVIALVASPAGEAAAVESAAEYLIGQQCEGLETAGAFRATLGHEAESECDTEAGGPNQAEVDATAVAAQALFAAGEVEAAQAAVEWLEEQAQPDGPQREYWESTACGAGPQPSVNSTALAVTGYVAASGEPPAVAKAQAWLEMRTSIAGWMEGCLEEESVEVRESNRARATTQGVLGLLGTTYRALAEPPL